MRNLGHVPALDGLRGVAIAAVVAYHAFGNPRGGWIGVQLFFVLSGFLITTLLLEERAATGRIRLRAFYVRRARRLLPALAALLAGYLVIAAVKGNNGLVEVAHWGLYTGNIYAAVSPNAATHLNGLNHLWSLAQEEQFYLVWPAALLVVCKTRRPARLLVGLAVALMLYRAALAFTGAPNRHVYFAPDTNLDALVLGAALAFHPIAVSRRLVILATSILVFVAALVAETAVLDASFLALAVPAAAVLVAAAVSGSLRLPRPLIWLGGISYSLYLWHYALLWAFDWRHPVAAVIVSVGAAWASTRWIERPFRSAPRRDHVAGDVATAPA